MIKIDKYWGLLNCFVIVIVINMIGCNSSPLDLLISPIGIVFLSLILNFNTNKFHPILSAIFLFTFISLNDIGIKLYSGGTHDLEGQGLVNLSLIVGLVPAFVIFIISMIKRKEFQILIKIISTSVFIILVLLHFYLFSSLGINKIFLMK